MVSGTSAAAPGRQMYRLVVSKWGSVAMGVYIERCTDDISVIA